MNGRTPGSGDPDAPEDDFTDRSARATGAGWHRGQGVVRVATILVVASIIGSIVVQTAGNMSDMFTDPRAWALNIAGLAGAMWLRKAWLIVLAGVAILWPVVAMVP